MREHEIYFLQRQNGDIWDTLLSAETSEALEETLREAIADAIPAALRIAVGDYQTETNAWTYQQIFFLDKNSYRPPAPRHEAPTTVAEPQKQRDINVDFAELKRRLEAGEFDDEEPVRRSAGNNSAVGGIGQAEQQPDSTAAPAAEVAAKQTAQTSQTEEALGGDEKAAASEILAAWRERDNELEAPEELPQRSLFGRVLRFLFSLTIIIILAAIISFSALVILKHPIVMPYVDKFGLTEIVKNLGITSAPEDAGAPPVAQNAMAKITVNGPRLDYLGIPSQIKGKWSAGKCDQDYITFGKDSYISRTAAGDIDRTAVSQSFEDDYYIYLEVSTDYVEHFQKVDTKSLRHVGHTSLDGFTAKADSEIITTCDN